MTDDFTQARNDDQARAEYTRATFGDDALEGLAVYEPATRRTADKLASASLAAAAERQRAEDAELLEVAAAEQAEDDADPRPDRPQAAEAGDPGPEHIAGSRRRPAPARQGHRARSPARPPRPQGRAPEPALRPMTRYQGHPNNVGLDALRRELLNQDQKKAQRPEKAPAPALARRPVNHHGRERRAQLRRDLAGAPCAC